MFINMNTPLGFLVRDKWRPASCPVKRICWSMTVITIPLGLPRHFVPASAVKISKQQTVFGLALIMFY